MTWLKGNKVDCLIISDNILGLISPFMKLELDKGIDKGPMTLEQLEAKAEMEEAENARKELEEKLRSEMDNGEG